MDLSAPTTIYSSSPASDRPNALSGLAGKQVPHNYDDRAEFEGGNDLVKSPKNLLMLSATINDAKRPAR
jgi:hypothetical protein